MNSSSNAAVVQAPVKVRRVVAPVSEQIETLKEWGKRLGWWRKYMKWGLNPIQKNMVHRPLPEGAHGYYAVVFHKSMIADQYSGTDFSIPLEHVLEMLRHQRKGYFRNFFHEEDGNNLLKPDTYKRSKYSAVMMKRLWKSQGCPSDILLIPAQLGSEHRIESACKARLTMRPNEFPLDALEVAQILLTHPEALMDPYDDAIDCSGGECSGKRDAAPHARFNCVPSFKIIPARNGHPALVLFVEYGEGACVTHIHGTASGTLPDSHSNILPISRPATH